MASRRTDVFCFAVLAAVFYASFLVRKPCFYQDDGISITLFGKSNQTDESFVFSSLFAAKTNFYVRWRRKSLLCILLLICGDIEACPGPTQTTTLEDITRMRGIKIIHQNIRGLLGSFGNLCATLGKYKNIDIITLSETHITDGNSDEITNLFNIPGYAFSFKCRVNGSGGGVAMYVSNNITWKRRLDLETGEIEAIWIEVIQKNSKSFVVGSVYRPPDSSQYLPTNFNNLLADALIAVNEAFKEVIMLGDINANYFDKNSCKELKCVLSSNGFKQLVKSPTRVTQDTSTLIDVILTTREENIAKTTVTPLSLSDHDSIGCVRKLNHQKVDPRTITCRNYSKYDPEALKRDLSLDAIEPLYRINDVNKAWHFLRNILTMLFNKHAPMITKRVKGSFCPWLTTEIKKLMNRRDKLLRKCRKSKREEDWNAYKIWRNSCTSEIRKARSTYHQTLLTENEKNPKKFWQIIKSIFPGKKSRPCVPSESSKSKANTFCNFFSSVARSLKEKTFPLREFVWKPTETINMRTNTTFQFGDVSIAFVERELKKLRRNKSTGIDDLPPGMLKDVASEIAKPISYIINLSLRTGQVPTDWKIARVVPLHKSGSAADVNNYRPISILPVISKVLERAVHHQLMDYLERNKLLSDKQFGYRSKRSTELATALFVDSIRRSGDKGLLSGAVYLDLSKAFDTLDHSRLLEKMKSYGIIELALTWFTDYLFQRSQVVKLGQELSDPCPLTCGVPQGSILGPIMFLLFFNDFEDCLHHSSVVQFADDTVIYLSSKSIDEIEDNLNRDLASISTYLSCNDLVINLKKGKTECMLLGTSKRISAVAPDSRDLNLSCNGTKINCTQSYKYLGTVLDQQLNLAENFDKKYKKASAKLGLLRKLKPLMTIKAANAVYTSAIIPALNYNCIIQLNLTQTQLKKLKSIEARASSILKSKTCNLKHEIDKHAILLVRKCLNGKVCTNFHDYFIINEHNARTRNRNILLRIPKVKLEFAKNGFFFMGARLYNSLPKAIRESGDDFENKVNIFFK